MIHIGEADISFEISNVGFGMSRMEDAIEKKCYFLMEKESVNIFFSKRNRPISYYFF
jgi:hypothetical protein